MFPSECFDFYFNSSYSILKIICLFADYRSHSFKYFDDVVGLPHLSPTVMLRHIYEVFPLDPNPDALMEYPGCTPGMRRDCFLSIDLHTASLVGLRSGWGKILGEPTPLATNRKKRQARATWLQA
ncbi:hypothetical protein TNCV_2240071 [Trichonephila clavipes]|nr:hypothetical protein TNCV_2240071 [Trichonephila clavipes]